MKKKNIMLTWLPEGSTSLGLVISTGRVSAASEMLPSGRQMSMTFFFS